MNNKALISILAVVLSAVFLSACASPETTKTKAISDASWLSTELVNVQNNQSFSINDFKGQRVLMESFAVWCPTCALQQEEVNKLAQTDGTNIIHISLDTDQNEDAKIINDYLKEKGYSWRFAIAPMEMTQTLVRTFGLNFVNAPSAPVVIICEDQKTKFLKSGIKSSVEIEKEFDKTCS